MSEEPLLPGFMVVHGNHPEALRDLMLAWIARHPLTPLEDECVLVQSNGVAQWLKLSLARDAADGGIGIAAALRTELPSRFVWQAYRAVLGAQQVPAASPFDKPLLVWRLMRLLPALLAGEAFAPLRRFLLDDDDSRKRHQLAERLADLYDQYQVYRADWLGAWADGRDVIDTSRGGRRPVPAELNWQPQLWRALLADAADGEAAASRADVHRRFMAAAAGWHGERPAGLPRRLIVFGISSLPQQSLAVLAALARWTQVLMCVHNPCEHDWSHIVADKDLLRAERSRQRRRGGAEGAIPDEALHLHAQPLLAAWGKQGRDFIRLLDEHDDHASYAQRFAAIGRRIDCFERNPGDTLLRQLQDDILDLRPLVETRRQWPAVDVGRDRSIRFHVTHGAQREVEVLHDCLLAAFAADPSLRPRDVIVMVPDVAAYAPHVQAVFGLPPSDDARFIPYSIADRGQRHHDPLLGALEKLLALPQSRVTVSDVLDWLEVPALRRRFAIDESQLTLLRRWIAAANIRWGLHAEQRRALDLPDAPAQNSWDFGLQRMLLGYAVGAGEPWSDIEPLDEVGGLDAELLGPLVQLLSRLESHWRTLAEPAAPAEWVERLRTLLRDFFSADDDADGFTLLRLEGALQDWLDACAAARFDDELPLSVVREHWLASIDQSTLNQPFFAGAVTFATLMPMRAIPFRFVALLGMNDGDYPRSRMPADFDLMGRDYRPGDRSRREDDRYLFLEALLSAREHLHVSWVGRSILDQSERPASVLVAQLRDHLAAGWRLAGREPGHRAGDPPADEADSAREAGEQLLRALTIEHRLQPFHPAYFGAGDERLFSYAREWRAAAQPGRERAMPAALPPWTFEGPLTLRLLGDFLRDPVRSFLRERLGVRFEIEDPVGQDHEPFALDGLQNWRLQDELIQAQKAALDDGVSREAALQERLQRIAGRGELPAGAFGELVREQLAEPMTAMFELYEQMLSECPRRLPDEALDFLPDSFPESMRLVDWLGGLRAGEPDEHGGADRADEADGDGDGRDAGERCRLLLDSSSLVKDGSWRHDRLVPYWVAHVAAHLNGPPLRSRIISKAGVAVFEALDRAQARAYWIELLNAWREGMSRPLPLALQSSFAWLRKSGGAAAGHAGGGAAPQGVAEPVLREAREAARICYEGKGGGSAASAERGRSPAERERNPYLARVFPSFDALWADDEPARWASVLLQPLLDALRSGSGDARTGNGGPIGGAGSGGAGSRGGRTRGGRFSAGEEGEA